MPALAIQMSPLMQISILLLLHTVIALFYADQATSPVGSIVHTKTASGGCKTLFPESTWDESMHELWQETGQYPVVAIQATKTDEPGLAAYSCLKATYFEEGVQKKNIIGPFYLSCKPYHHLVFFIGPLLHCAYAKRGNCKDYYHQRVASEHLLQSPEDAACVKRLYQIGVPILQDQCQDVDYRLGTPKTIIAWASKDDVSQAPMTAAKYKVINHDIGPWEHQGRLKMTASEEQSAVVINPTELMDPIWTICMLPISFATAAANFNFRRHTTLNIGYLDFDFRWRGVYTLNMSYVDGWFWPALERIKRRKRLGP